MSVMRTSLSIVAFLFYLLAGVGDSVAQGLNCWYCYQHWNSLRWRCAQIAIEGYDTCTEVGLICEFGQYCSATCFLGEVLVSTPLGPRPIMELNVGDSVTSMDDHGALRTAQVTAIDQEEAWSYLWINMRIGVTDEHPFHVAGAWKKARELQIGDLLTAEDGGKIRVASIDRIDKGVRVYNLTVDGQHNFFAEGVLVHNKGPLPMDP